MILQFAGVQIHDLNHLINTVSMTAVGLPADVVIWRERQEVRLKITVGDRERTLAEAPEATSQPKLPDRQGDPAGLFRRPNRPESTSSFAMGMELVTLNPQLALPIICPRRCTGR